MCVWMISDCLFRIYRSIYKVSGWATRMRLSRRDCSPAGTMDHYGNPYVSVVVTFAPAGTRGISSHLRRWRRELLDEDFGRRPSCLWLPSVTGLWTINVAFDNCGEIIQEYPRCGRWPLSRCIHFDTGNDAWRDQVNIYADVRGTRSPLAWLFVCDDFASWWSKICFVVVHQPMIIRSGRKLRMQPRCPQ
jgi:hypothetical protein